MNLSVGIVGLPNVGKSTLFNALLKKQQALAANYPFATIEPNVGIVPVPDERLTTLAEITKAEEKMAELSPIKPATVEFVDIAGLVKGAAEGAGLGNKFLSHIREVGIVAHVVRVFEDENIIKEGAVDPKSDYETITMELMLADAQTLTKALENRKMEPDKRAVAQKVLDGINANTPVRLQNISEEETALIQEYGLLSAKQEIVVLNVAEETYNPEGIERVSNQYAQLLGIAQEKCVVICAKIESELSELSPEDQKQYLADLGLQASGLERLIQKAFTALGLISFLTCGEKEVRSWTIRDGITAQLAAGEIHTDFIKKFIRAEVVAYTDFIACAGWKGAREKGKARLEGKEYLMKDGDVVEFKIGA
jgi:GTP-binding protein YchF